MCVNPQGKGTKGYGTNSKPKPDERPKYTQNGTHTRTLTTQKLNSEKARPGSFWALTWSPKTVSGEAGSSRENSAETGFFAHSWFPRMLGANCLVFPGCGKGSLRLEIQLGTKLAATGPKAPGILQLQAHFNANGKKDILARPSLLASGWHPCFWSCLAFLMS